MHINNSEFCSFIKTAKDIQHLGFINCVLITDSKCEFKFKDNWKIEELSLYGTGKFSDWKEFPERFMNIIDGIANCNSFVMNLTIISINESGFSKKVKHDMIYQAYKIFKEKSENAPVIWYQ